MPKMLQNDPAVLGEYFNKYLKRWDVRLGKGRRPRMMRRPRYIMAKYLCCLKYGLPSRLAIHHKDNDTTNDYIDNLQIMLHGAHTRFSCLGRSKYGVSYTLNPSEYHRRVDMARQDYRKQYQQNHKEQYAESCKRWRMKKALEANSN